MLNLNLINTAVCIVEKEVAWYGKDNDDRKSKRWCS